MSGARDEMEHGRPVRAALLVLAVALIGVSLIGLVRSQLADPRRFPISEIRVTGEFRHLDQRQLERVVADSLGGNYFTLDMQRARDELQRMPWVDQVAMRRIWPEQLEIAVTEQVALARWGDAALVNARGEVFEPTRIDGFEALPLLRGPTGSASVMVGAYERFSLLLRAAEHELRELELDRRGEWRLRTARGDVALLGEQLPDRRLKRFLLMLPRLAGKTAARWRVDLRYAHGFALAPSEEVARQNNLGDAEVKG